MGHHGLSLRHKLALQEYEEILDYGKRNPEVGAWLVGVGLGFCLSSIPVWKIRVVAESYFRDRFEPPSENVEDGRSQCL